MSDRHWDHLILSDGVIKIGISDDEEAAVVLTTLEGGAVEGGGYVPPTCTAAILTPFELKSMIERLTSLHERLIRRRH